jgi:hypothetical protein
MKIRHFAAAAAVAATILTGAGVATAAPHVNAHRGGNGWLTVTVVTGNVTTTTRLQPGKAVQLAQATCANVAVHPPLAVAPAGTVLVAPADLTVDAVRVNFPAATAVCTGVTVTSTHGVDAAEAEAPEAD